MKTVRFLVIALLTIICADLNAQVFTGGNIGFNANGGSTSNGSVTTDKPSNLGFNLSPKVGYFFSERAAAGIGLNFAYSRTKTPGNPDVINTAGTFGFAPFLRYYAVKKEKFSVFGQVNVGVSSSGSTNKVGNVSTDGPKTTMLYLNVYPALSYDISDRFSLETSLNFLGLSLNNSTIKTGNDKNTTNSFGLDAGLDNVVNVGDITIGAIYKF